MILIDGIKPSIDCSVVLDAAHGESRASSIHYKTDTLYDPTETYTFSYKDPKDPDADEVELGEFYPYLRTTKLKLLGEPTQGTPETEGEPTLVRRVDWVEVQSTNNILNTFTDLDHIQEQLQELAEVSFDAGKLASAVAAALVRGDNLTNSFVGVAINFEETNILGRINYILLSSDTYSRLPFEPGFAIFEEHLTNCRALAELITSDMVNAETAEDVVRALREYQLVVVDADTGELGALFEVPDTLKDAPMLMIDQQYREQLQHQEAIFITCQYHTNTGIDILYTADGNPISGFDSEQAALALNVTEPAATRAEARVECLLQYQLMVADRFTGEFTIPQDYDWEPLDGFEFDDITWKVTRVAHRNSDETTTLSVFKLDTED